MNQRLRLNFRLAFTSFFLGILTAFMVWSFQWVMESWKEVKLDMPGDVTVLRMIEGPQMVTEADEAVALEELKAYLRERSLALIVSSVGDGRPEILLYDPHGVVSWFPRGNPEDSQLATDEVYLFQGTYSDRRWSESRTTSLLPKGVMVKGVIRAPRGAGDLQYARRIGGDPLPPGQYTINTTDPAHVRQILALLYRMGLIPQSAQKVPFLLYATQNPLLIITMLFLTAGSVVAVFYWSLNLRGRAREFGLRSRHGALPWDLVRENLVGGLPGLVLGGVIGVFFAGVLLAAIGQIHLAPDHFLTLAGAAAASVVSGIVTWFLTLYLTIRIGYPFNRVTR